MLGLSVPMIMLLSLSHSSKSMKVRFFFLWIIMIILVLHSLVLVYCSMTPSASLHRHPAASIARVKIRSPGDFGLSGTDRRIRGKDSAAS